MRRILDGCMEALLRPRAEAPEHPFWAVQQLLDAPERVRDAHAAFLDAGAGVIRTHTGTLTRRTMTKHGAWERFAEAIGKACAAAEAARDAVNPAALIAGRLDSAGLTTTRPIDPRGMEAEFAEQALMLSPFVDLFVCDAMPSAAEALAAARAASATGKPVWVAFTLRDAGSARLRGGETIAHAVATLAKLDVDAFMLTATAPRSVAAGLPELAAVAGGTAVGAAANGFVDVPGAWDGTSGVDEIVERRLIDEDDYAGHAAAWASAGATILGGAHGVGPGHIARLSALSPG